MLEKLSYLTKQKTQAFKHHCKKQLFGESVSTPVLIVLGAQKSGTTALYTYLDKHPNIQVPRPKELNYFSSIEPSKIDVNNYLDLFPKTYGRQSISVSVDISPSYLLDCRHCVGLAEQLDLPFKYLVVLREPVARAISAWHMYKQLLKIDPNWFLAEKWVINFQQLGTDLIRRSANFGDNFVADIEAEIEVLEQGKRIEYPIVEFGLYEDQLSALYSMVDSSNILILNNLELKNNTQVCLSKVLKFMQLEDHNFNDKDLQPQFVGQAKSALPENQLTALREYYNLRNKGIELRFPSAKKWSL